MSETPQRSIQGPAELVRIMMAGPSDSKPYTLEQAMDAVSSIYLLNEDEQRRLREHLGKGQ